MAMERNLNILVVDDEQVVLDSIQKHLKKDNYTIHTALTAKAGLDLIDTASINIVLTDLMMPEMDGLEFMKEVKARNEHTPVIMITGYATINTALQAMELGAFDYIAKPFTKSELRAVLQRAAEVVMKSDTVKVKPADKLDEKEEKLPKELKVIGDFSWMMVEADGVVLLGVERSFLHTIGRIQNIFLPSAGDKLRQGGSYLQIFSADLRSHTVLSPLSGTVLEVNEKVLANPDSVHQDPYGDGWLIRLKPSRFDIEIKELGL
jgi:CheY-like chemotaxis protein/glycine cleavage system H lipoate-binding protein